jgi:hypothetical protein
MITISALLVAIRLFELIMSFYPPFSAALFSRAYPPFQLDNHSDFYSAIK